MIDAKRLLADLKRLRRRLDDDLREHHSASPGRAAVQAEWQAARDAGRTADTLETFWTAALDQAAVHWLLAAAFLVWWGLRTLAIWRTEEVDYYARAASIVTGTLLLHSLVDYPLRTAALSAVFAACLGLMSDVRPFTRRSSRSSTTNVRNVTL